MISLSPGDPAPPDTRWIRRVWSLVVVAIVMRLGLFLGRGDYVAFDEGWYLLLGRSLMRGEGYSLIGIPHVTLSPLFPLVAGPMGALLGDWVWGGRVVAALASGLVVIPLWGIARRLVDLRTAFLAVCLYIVLPSMAPFVAAYWVGADLWVGAEPLLHLALCTGIWCWMMSDATSRTGVGLLAGLAFGFAFLARPEAVIVLALVIPIALVTTWRHRGRARLTGLIVGFLCIATPYWVYLHGVTGEWQLSGRGVRLEVVLSALRGAAAHPAAHTQLIEGALADDDEAYVAQLFSLEASGSRMQSDYWGVRPRGASASSRVYTVAPPAAAITKPSLPHVPRWRRYLSSLMVVVPLGLWPLILLGLWGGGRGIGRDGWFMLLPLVGTSVLIARFVAVDARTQLFLGPFLMIHAARGIMTLARIVGRLPDVRPVLVERVLVIGTVVPLLLVHLERLHRSLTIGSPHHIVGAQNRQAAAVLTADPAIPPGPVIAGHPAIALFADRSWRPLPAAPLGRILPYAIASDASVLVLSSYYAPFKGQEILGARYLIVPLSPSVPRVGPWQLTRRQGDAVVARGEITAGR